MLVWLLLFKVQRIAIHDHMKRNTESHLKLACESLRELQVSSTSTFANIEEMQTEIATAMKKIQELSEAGLKSGGLEDLRDKIAVTNKKLEVLQSGEDVTDALSSLQSEVVAINKEVKELSRKVGTDGKLMELQGAINELQKLIPRIDSLQGLRKEVAGINKKLQKLQEAISSLEKGNSDATRTICNDRGVLDEIEHVEYELRREFQTQLRCLRENAERDKKELLDRLRADQEITRKRIVYSFLYMSFFILLCIRCAVFIDSFLDIILTILHILL